jgi:hypothetical protein
MAGSRRLLGVDGEGQGEEQVRAGLGFAFRSARADRADG